MVPVSGSSARRTMRRRRYPHTARNSCPSWGLKEIQWPIIRGPKGQYSVIRPRDEALGIPISDRTAPACPPDRNRRVPRRAGRHDDEKAPETRSVVSAALVFSSGTGSRCTPRSAAPVLLNIALRANVSVAWSRVPLRIQARWRAHCIDTASHSVNSTRCRTARPPGV